MRRGFYCDQPEPDGLPPELGDLDTLRGRHTADRVLRLLRDTAATRRVRVGVAVVGSLGAIAIASPVSSLLHTTADADTAPDAAGPPSAPPTATTPPSPAPPTTQPPAEPQPAHEPRPAHQAQAQPAAAAATPPSPERVHHVRTLVTAAEQAVAGLARSVTDAEHAVSTALTAAGPDQVLAALDKAVASVSHTKTAADTVAQHAHDAATQAAQLGDPALASRARTAQDTATNLAQRATATLDTHAHSVGQARYATLVAATQRAVSQAEPPVAAAEAAAARADRATAAVKRALDAHHPSTVVAPLLNEAVAALDAAAAPVAGGAAAGKAITDSAQHIREKPQRDAADALSNRANTAANRIKQLRIELPNLQRQLTTLRHAENVADTTTKAAAARDAVATVQKALDDATTVHVTGLTQRDARDFAAAERSAADANTKLTLATKAQADADKALTDVAAILTPDLVNVDPELRPAADTLRAAQQANTTNSDRIRVLAQHITTLTQQAKNGRQAADRDAAFRDQATKQPLLQQGSREAPAIRQMKTMLNQAADARLDVNNSNFGATTLQRVKAFQATHGLPATGAVDAATWYQLIAAAGGLPPAPTTPPPIAPAAAAAPNEKAAVAVRAALTQVGVPYQWGASNPGRGFDCSGLTQWAYQQAGVQLPRTSTTQAVGARVSVDQLQPGDLVVWNGHVAMYTGNGQMIEAGNPVQVSKLRTTNIGMPFLGFYRPAA